jgi:hypothetical protein
MFAAALAHPYVGNSVEIHSDDLPTVRLPVDGAGDLFSIPVANPVRGIARTTVHVDGGLANASRVLGARLRYPPFQVRHAIVWGRGLVDLFPDSRSEGETYRCSNPQKGCYFLVAAAATAQEPILRFPRVLYPAPAWRRRFVTHDLKLDDPAVDLDAAYGPLDELALAPWRGALPHARWYLFGVSPTPGAELTFEIGP